MLPETSTRQQHPRERYPNCVPVHVRRARDETEADIRRHKFVVPETWTVGQFVWYLRHFVSVNSGHTVFFLTEDARMVDMTSTMWTTWHDHKTSDDVLHLQFRCENAFG
jgi:hypothetical protein